MDLSRGKPPLGISASIAALLGAARGQEREREEQGAAMRGWGYFALIDTEKLCGEDSLDMLGMNANGGKALNFFFKNLWVGVVSSKEHGVHAAYVHLNFVKMISTSSSGVLVEE